MMLVPLWSRCGYRASEVVPLSTARGWAHALAIWDYLRGKTMAWQASGSGVSSVRRYQAGVVAWNGVIAVAWPALAIWRTVEYRSLQYVIVVLLGLLYAASTVRLIRQPRKPTPPRSAIASAAGSAT